MTVTSLYQAILDFLNFFFPTDLTATTATLNQLIAVVGTYFLIWTVLIGPMVRLIYRSTGGNKK
jgi:hypothetical protein